MRFHPAYCYWSPVASCLPVFVCLSVHVSLLLLLVALLHVGAVPDPAVGPSNTNQKTAFPQTEKSLWLNPHRFVDT